MSDYDIDGDGNVVRTIPSVIIDRYEFMEELAEQKLAFMKFRADQMLEIETIRATIASEDARITKMHRKLIVGMKRAEKNNIMKNMTALNNKLAEAFPSDFEKHIPTVVAEE